jgi:RNA polymerase sigma factor (sigma-70 family)
MRDSDIVAAIAARDPDGLAQVYDKYAARLFGFCRSLLREPAGAAGAVQDTFLIAASRLDQLPDHDRLRPWLYAVARYECHRRLRAGAAPATLDETTEPADESADASDLAARAELRDLVRAAILGLQPGDQEVIELSLRHDLHGADLADVLGVSRQHADARAVRARGQLENSLEPELRPVMLLGFAPLAIIPASLRAQLLQLAADPSAAAVAQRAAIVQRAGQFGAHGFPAATAAPHVPGVAGAMHAAVDRAGRRWRPAHGHAAVITGSVATAAVVGAVAILVMVLPQATHQGRAVLGAPGTARAAGRPTAAARPAARKPTGTRPDASSSAAGSLAQQHASRPGRPSPAGDGAPGAAAGAPSPGAAAAGAGGGTTPASGPATTGPAPTVNGPVTVSPGTLILAGLLGGSATGTLTLSAGSTPVTHYTISIPSSLLGHLTVSPASGSIPAHGRQRVTVTVTGLLSVDTTITVGPGGHPVTVLLGVHLGG